MSGMEVGIILVCNLQCVAEYKVLHMNGKKNIYSKENNLVTYRKDDTQFQYLFVKLWIIWN